MNHYILFMTASGPCLVFICVGKNVDIESDIGERALHENFGGRDDVGAFMDKYISDVRNPHYMPYWHFENIVVVPD